VAGTPNLGGSQSISLQCYSSGGAPTLADASITVLATP
jgi:hypothetical protein